MTIVTVQFDYGGGPAYSTLLDVFRRSIEYNMPDARFEAIQIPVPERIRGRAYNLSYNTEKLRVWANYLNSATDNVIFADCDMLCVASAYHAFDPEFDVAYTERSIVKRIPINGGIVMARPTDAARAWFRELFNVNCEMLKNERFHNEWRKMYAGMNQSAMGYMLHHGRAEANIHKYKTKQWNAVDCDWGSIGSDTVFVHMKSGLRKAVLNRYPPFGSYAKAMKLWYDYAGVEIPKEVPTSKPYGGVPKRVVKRRRRGKR